MRRWFTIFITAGKSWFTDNAFKHSAAVSYYTLFSMAPITIIALAVAGFFFGTEAARGQFAAQMTQLLGRPGAEALQHIVANSRPQQSGWASTVAGVVLLVVGATTVMSQLQDSLNDIWQVAARPTRHTLWHLLLRRLISFAMVLSIGLLLLVSLILSTSLAALVRHFGTSLSPVAVRAVDFFTGLAVIAVLFALMFKFLPDVRLEWRDVWRGAALTALLFDVGRFMIALYLDNTGVASTFGAAGSLVALLVWVYYSSAILFFGVEVTRAGLIVDKRVVHPAAGAARVRRELQL